MNESEWRKQFLNSVSNCSSEGRKAVDYIRARKIQIGIRRARKSVGAFWTLTNAAYLNSTHYTQESSLANPGAWTLLIHEVRHLQQGWFTALSIYGELDAWQCQLQVYKKITGKPLNSILGEILSLPLNRERENLQRARKLMTQYAGRSYGANWLPLYPIHKEIKYWATGKQINLYDFFQKHRGILMYRDFFCCMLKAQTRKEVAIDTPPEYHKNGKDESH